MVDNSENDIERQQRDKDEEMATMAFQRVKIEFYPEDIAKMEKMTRDEKMEFVKKLREDGKYMEVPE